MNLAIRVLPFVLFDSYGTLGQFSLIFHFKITLIGTVHENYIARLLLCIKPVQRRTERFSSSRRIMRLSPVFIRDELNDELKDSCSVKLLKVAQTHYTSLA